ncbi:MAG: hypothetical protein QG623_606 [Patescibacteria group bacterium]|nr:hypothetical protein [Patescibacteria group bacterium]
MTVPTSKQLPYFSKKRNLRYLFNFIAFVILITIVSRVGDNISWSDLTYIWLVGFLTMLEYIFIFLPIYINWVRKSGRFVFFRQAYGLQRVLTPLGKEPFAYHAKPYGVFASYILWVIIWLGIMLFLFMPTLAILSTVFGIGNNY